MQGRGWEGDYVHIPVLRSSLSRGVSKLPVCSVQMGGHARRAKRIMKRDAWDINGTWKENVRIRERSSVRRSRDSELQKSRGGHAENGREDSWPAAAGINPPLPHAALSPLPKILLRAPHRAQALAGCGKDISLRNVCCNEKFCWDQGL